MFIVTKLFGRKLAKLARAAIIEKGGGHVVQLAAILDRAIVQRGLSISYKSFVVVTTSPRIGKSSTFRATYIDNVDLIYAVPFPTY